MTIWLKPLLAWLTVMATGIAYGQQTQPESPVEMRYCEMKFGRPPLKYLSFDITVRNSFDRPQWFLFPAALYDKPVAERKNAGIDAVELFSDREHKVTIVHFMGTMKLQPDGAGGFKGVLLPAGAVVSIHGFGISFWGEPVSPVHIRVVVADKITLGGTEIGEWLGKNLLSAKTAEVKDLERAGSKMAPELKELPVEIMQSGEITMEDALARKCAK